MVPSPVVLEDPTLVTPELTEFLALLAPTKLLALLAAPKLFVLLAPLKVPALLAQEHSSESVPVQEPSESSLEPALV